MLAKLFRNGLEKQCALVTADQAFAKVGGLTLEAW
jgi:hypothetical protein